MTFQKSLLLGLTGVIATTATPAFGQSNSENEILFDCKINNEIPVTVLYNPENREKPPVNIITWEKKYIHSDNINNDLKKDCDQAAKKLNERFGSVNLSDKSDESFYLGLRAISFKEDNSDKEDNSENKKTLLVVCLPKRRGESCERNHRNQLLSINFVSDSKEERREIFEKIINPGFAEFNVSDMKTYSVTFPPIKPRNFLQRFFGIK